MNNVDVRAMILRFNFRVKLVVCHHDAALPSRTKAFNQPRAEETRFAAL